MSRAHGDLLAIWDLRPGARQRLTILEGPERELYLYCGDGRSGEEIEVFAGKCAAAFDATAFSEQWINDRLMVFLDGRYLSVAVNELSNVARSDPVGAARPAREALAS